MDILASVPASLIAGDTVVIDRVVDGVPTGDGWTVQLSLVSLTGTVVDVAGAEQGTAFRLTLSGSTTADLEPGVQSWALMATKDGARTTVDRGRIVVEPNPTDGTASVNTELAHVERVIAACQARLEGKATDDVQMYQLPDGVTVSRLTLREVRELLAQYKAKRARMLSRGRPRIREVWYALR